MRNTTQARQSRSEMPIDVLSSKNVTALLDATKASPGYTETGVGQNTGPVVESAIDKFSQILTGKKLSTVHQAWESWRRSPKFNNAPMEGRITPSLSPGVKDETVRTNLSNVALSINPYNRSFAFVYTNKNIPGGIPTAEQFIKNCNEAAGESKPEDSTR
jgi:hypothetical protein